MTSNHFSPASFANAVGATLKKPCFGPKPQYGPNLSSILFAVNQKLEFQVSHVENLDTLIKSKIASIKNSIVLHTAAVKSNDTTNHQELFKTSDVQCWSSHTLKAPLRLRNTGNSCYLNAVLQCVLATTPLVGFCETQHKEPEKCPLSSKGRLCYLCEVGRLLKAQRINNQTVCPTKFLNNIKSVMRSLSYDSQEDAHEYFLGILSKMEQNALVGYEHLPVKVKDTNPIRSIFGGVTRSQVICQSCHKVSSRDEQMFNLSLDITKAQTIKECLENYTRVEHLKGPNAYKCESCSALRHAKRHVTLHTCPKILTIQFNRFSRFHKIDSNVHYPMQLDLRPFMSQKDGPAVLYKLYATVNHKGASCRSGHYIAYARRNNQWQCLDDDEIRFVGPNEVLSSHPYLLYYERVDSNNRSFRALTSETSCSSKAKLYPIFNGHSSPQNSKRHQTVLNGNSSVNTGAKRPADNHSPPSLQQLNKKKQASIIQGAVGRDIRSISDQKQLSVKTNGPFQNYKSDAIMNFLKGGEECSTWNDQFSPPEIVVQKRSENCLKRPESQVEDINDATEPKRIKIEESIPDTESSQVQISPNASPPIIKSTTCVRQYSPKHFNKHNWNNHTKSEYKRHFNKHHYKDNWHHKSSHNHNFHRGNFKRNKNWTKNRHHPKHHKSNLSYNNFRYGMKR